MATSSLSAARRCTQYCIRGSQWQPLSLVRHKSTTSAINAGLKASRREIPDRGSRSRGNSRDATPRSSAFTPSRGRSRDRKETRRGQKRDDRRGGIYGKRDHDNDLGKDTVDLKSDRRAGPDHKRSANNKSDIWEGTVALKSDRSGGSRDKKGNEKKTGGWNSAVDLESNRKGGREDRTSHGKRPSETWLAQLRTAEEKYNDKAWLERQKAHWEAFPTRHTKEIDAEWERESKAKEAASKGGGRSRDVKRGPSSKDGNKTQRLPGKTSRFDNQGVRSYGDSAGFFSKESRSNRDTDRPATREFDPSARSSQVDRVPVRRLPSRPVIEQSTSTRGEHGEQNQDDNVPISIPYSSAASQWLYGANTVIGALRGKQRQVYQLIVKKGEKSTEVNQIVRLAKEADIPIKTHDDTRLLDKLSEGRPHNGVVLEASALPARPVAHLRKPDSQRGDIPLVLYQQNAEDAAINGTSTAIPYNASSWRQPLILFLDGILDPQNLGGILRTAHFYGVDAVAVSTRTCAPLTSPFLAKASAGACEAIPILAVSKAADFILKSGLAGWHVCAAVAPDVRSQEVSKQATTVGLSLSSPLAKRPCILMMGSEGEGLRDNLRSKADLEVTIERAMPAMDVGVDSMNVSVATGVLVDAFMRKPNTPAAASNNSNRVF